MRYCCNSENDGFNTRVNDSIAMVKTTESLLKLKNLFIFIIICHNKCLSFVAQWYSIQLWHERNTSPAVSSSPGSSTFLFDFLLLFTLSQHCFLPSYSYCCLYYHNSTSAVDSLYAIHIMLFKSFKLSDSIIIFNWRLHSFYKLKIKWIQLTLNK